MKGVGFTNIHNYVLFKHTPATWEQVLASMSPHDAETIRGAVAVGWYDVYLFGRLLRAVDSVCGHGDLSLMEKIGEYECEHDFNRVLRVFMRVLSPPTLMAAEARLWKHFQDSGDYRSETIPNGMITTLSGWAEDKALCRELGGYLQRLVSFAAAKPVRMSHPECRASGARACVYRFTWE
jgi:hypothetical protein